MFKKNRRNMSRDYNFFDKKELNDCQTITNALEIQNCPDYMRMDIYDRNIKNGVVINPQSESFFLEQFPKTFIISTRQNDYECNLFGICSSKVLHDFITANPDSTKYVYDYNDEYNEFQQICDFFNFSKIFITTSNSDFLKEISEDLQIDIIINMIKRIDQKQEKIIEKIDENQKIVDKINQLFEWLYKINDFSVELVKNFIIESKWSKTEENVQEMVAFILQVIKTDDLLHPSLIELLIQLNSENSNELKILFPFLKDKLLKTFDQERYSCEFVYRLYKKGLITKEELYSKLKKFEKLDASNHLISWFLPELIELGCFNEQKFNKNTSSSNIWKNYYPDKMDLYKKMRDSFEPDDEITRALRIDDVDTFQSIISTKNIKDISVCFVPSNIFDLFNVNEISYLNYSAAFGSIKCFKYLLLNHAKIDSQTFFFALHGGNIEIIKIADNQKQDQNKNDHHQKYQWGSSNIITMSQILKTLIQKQRNDLFDWVFEQKITNFDTIRENLSNIISCSASNGNAHALVSIIDKGFNIFDIISGYSLQSKAATEGFYHLLKFLNRIEYKNTNECHHFYGNNNTIYVTYGNLNIFKYYIKTNPDENSIIKSAIKLDYPKMYNYFFDQQSDKITHSIITIALSESLEKKTNDLFYYFIEKFKKVCPSVFDKYNWNIGLLQIACRNGKIEPFYFIINLIDKSKNPNFTDCLLTAASSDSLEICKYLIDNKFSFNYFELFRKISNVPKVSSEIILLLFNSSGLEFDKTIFLPLLSPTIRVSNVNFAEFLIERDIFYDECLIDAVSAKSLDIVNIILKHHSSPTFINRGSGDGTALHIAINIDSLEILRRLLEIPSINPYLYDKNNQTPLMLVVNQMKFPMIKEIISFSGKNIIYHRESIDLLLEMLFKGSSPKKRNYSNYSNWVSSYNYNSKISSADQDNINETLEMLLNVPNIEMVFDEKNQKYFAEVCSKQNIDIKMVQFFLKIKTIDVNCISTINGETVLTSAVKAQRIDIIKLLINHPRINCNLANTNCETPLSLAVQKMDLEIVKLLLSVPSINPYLYDKSNKTSLMIAADQMLLPIINEIISFSGKNIIYHRESIDFLLEALIKVISINNNNKNKNTNYTYEDVVVTLQMLLSFDDIQMIFDEKNQKLFLNIFSNKNIDIKLVKIFLNFDKFDVNTFSPRDGNTPLISVLKEERVDIAELLINDPRTNINMTNYSHESALIIATQKQYNEIVKLLINNPRFDPIESGSVCAFVISNDEIFDILLSMNLFDINCVIVNSKSRNNSGWGSRSSNSYGSSWGSRSDNSYGSSWGSRSDNSYGSSWGSRSDNSYGSSWGSGSTIFESGETALIQAAKNSNLTRFERIIKHPSFDKNKSKLSKSIHILMSSIKKENVRDFLNILKDNNLIDEFFKDTQLIQRLLVLNCIEIFKEIFEGKFGPFVVTNELILQLFQFSLRIDRYSLNALTFLINYDKEHNKTINFHNSSFLYDIQCSRNKKLYKEVEDVVNLLVENGCDVNKQGSSINGFEKSSFPLKSAILNDKFALIRALLKTNKIDFNQKILYKRFPINERNDDEEDEDNDQNVKLSYDTYLHLAAGSKDSEILKIFLEFKVLDVNVKNSNNETPLMIACSRLLEKNIKILFTKDDLDFRCRNNENEDALQIVQNVGEQNESDYSNESPLTKEQYLNSLISVINEKRLRYGIENYDDEEEKND